MSDDDAGGDPTGSAEAEASGGRATVRIDEEGDLVGGGRQGEGPERIEEAIPPADGAFDWRGWLLVGVVVVAFLVVPVVVALRPLRVGGFRTTYLLLPLVPAFLLGATAVWVAVSSRRE